VDPKFIWDKEKFVNLLTPIIYKHFCELYGMQEVTPLACIQHLELFAEKQILPTVPDFFYYGSGIVSSGYASYDWS
jgi:hypothetical protein